MAADDPTPPGTRSDDPTLPGRLGARRPLSTQSMRLGDELEPILVRWAKAETREQRVTAWVDALETIANDGARRRDDLERENAQLRGELEQTRQALSLSEEHRTAIRRGADAEIKRLRDRIRALGGEGR